MNGLNQQPNVPDHRFGPFLDRISAENLWLTDEIDRPPIPDAIRGCIEQLTGDSERSRLMLLKQPTTNVDNVPAGSTLAARWMDSRGIAQTATIAIERLGDESQLQFIDANPPIRWLSLLEVTVRPQQFKALTYSKSLLEWTASAASDQPTADRTTSNQSLFELAGASDTDLDESIELEAQIRWRKGGQRLDVAIVNGRECGLEDESVWAVVEVTGLWTDSTSQQTRSVVVELRADDADNLVPVAPVILQRPMSDTGFATVTLRSFTTDDLWRLDSGNEQDTSQTIRFLAEHKVQCAHLRNLHSQGKDNNPNTAFALQIVDDLEPKREAASADALPFLKQDDADQVVGWLCTQGMDKQESVSLVAAWTVFQPKAVRLIRNFTRNNSRGRVADILQDTLLSVLQAASRGNYELATPEPWFTTIVKNCCINWYRKETGSNRKANRRVSYSDSLPDVQQQSDAIDDSKELRFSMQIDEWLTRFVTQLSDDEQTYWVECHVHGLKGKALQNALNLTNDQVRTLRSTTRHKLTLLGAMDRIQGRDVIGWDDRIDPLLEETDERGFKLKWIRGWTWPEVQKAMQWTKRVRIHVMRRVEPLVMTTKAAIQLAADGAFDQVEFDFAEAWLTRQIDAINLEKWFGCDASAVVRQKHSIGANVFDWMRKNEVEDLCLVPEEFRLLA